MQFSMIFFRSTFSCVPEIFAGLFLAEAVHQLTDCCVCQHDDEETTINQVNHESAKTGVSVKKGGRGRPRKMEADQLDSKAQSFDGKSNGQMNSVCRLLSSASVD